VELDWGLAREEDFLVGVKEDVKSCGLSQEDACAENKWRNNQSINSATG